MNFFFLIVSIFIGSLSVSTAFAGDKSECVYGSNVDQVISFYQGRLYLLDSEYTILSDIGKDAMKMVNYLQGRKEQLVKEMINKELDFKSHKIQAFVVNKARISDVGLGYTKP